MVLYEVPFTIGKAGCIIRATGAGLEVKTRADKLYMRTSLTIVSTNSMMAENTQNIYPQLFLVCFFFFYNTN